MSRPNMRAIINYGVSPVFFALAIVNFILERQGNGHHAQAMEHGEGHMMEMASDTSWWTGLMQGDVLGSMWLMYVLMALAHIAPWLPKRR